MSRLLRALHVLVGLVIVGGACWAIAYLGIFWHVVAVVGLWMLWGAGMHVEHLRRLLERLQCPTCGNVFERRKDGDR
jgi:hypothetical protein